MHLVAPAGVKLHHLTDQILSASSWRIKGKKNLHLAEDRLADENMQLLSLFAVNNNQRQLKNLQWQLRPC